MPRGQDSAANNNMNKVTVKYNVDEVSRELNEGTTYRQVVSDANLKAVLGYGDNVRVLVNGVEQSMDAAVQNGVIIRIETAANSKAAVVVKYGSTSVTKEVDDIGDTPDEILSSPVGMLFGINKDTPNLCVKINGESSEFDDLIDDDETVEFYIEEKASVSVSVAYNVDSESISVPSGTTYAQLLANANLKAKLGYGDNVRALVNGVEQSPDAAVVNGTSIRVETRANQKA